MGEYKGTPGELIYEYTLRFTQVVAYGASADAVLSGRIPPPAEGARFDVYFEGLITGPRLKGTVRGVDYLHVRGDGRCQLDIHAEITTEDGKKIALAADGVAIPESPASPDAAAAAAERGFPVALLAATPQGARPWRNESRIIARCWYRRLARTWAHTRAWPRASKYPWWFQEPI